MKKNGVENEDGEVKKRGEAKKGGKIENMGNLKINKVESKRVGNPTRVVQKIAGLNWKKRGNPEGGADHEGCHDFTEALVIWWREGGIWIMAHWVSLHLLKQTLGM